MFKQGFTVTGSSLKLLKPGERGVVSRLKCLDDRMSRKLQEMGIRIGTTITLEQRFPRFIVKVSGHSFAISTQLMDAIYVRLEQSKAALAKSKPYNVITFQSKSCPISPALNVSGKP